MFPSGATFLCPDWKAKRVGPKIGSSADAFRRIALPRLLSRPGVLRGTAQAKTRFRTVPYGTFGVGPAALALEATLERIIPSLGTDGAIEQGLSLQREDIIVQFRPEPALRLLVILDTSLSMDGPHRGMAALIGAVLARETPSGSLALMAFHSEPQLIIRFGERVKPLEAAYRVFRTPVGGVTNISAALEYGLHILAASGIRLAHAVLITDGERTAGTDPCGPAKRFRNLHVVLVGQRNTVLTKEMARVGKGFWRQVDCLDNVPPTLLWLMQRLRAA